MMGMARAGLLSAVGALLAAGVAIVPAAAVETQRLAVQIDHAQVSRLPAGTSTIVVGNPLVADATVQQNGVMVVTGRSYGRTNILILDDKGRTLSDVGVDVTASAAGVVTVYRGTGRETYACAPLCETTLRVGDRTEYFDSVAGAITRRTGLSKGPGGE
jgi:hypothetical protein